MLISPEAIAFHAALAADEDDYQHAIIQAREYDAGKQFIVLTDRLREFLGAGGEDWQRLRLNVCHVVLSAPVERMLVGGFDTDETPQQTAGVNERGEPTTVLTKPVATWAWKVWQQNRMDAKQRRVHEMTLRDSESFVIVDWDNEKGRPRFTPHQRYVDGRNQGDDDGCRAFYRNDDPDQDLLYVTKQWTEVTYTGGTRTNRRRLTVYYPDHIEKYVGFPGAWQRIKDAPEEPWPIPWKGRDGRPLGIPVAHFRSSAGMEARDAWPIQNAINKAFVDLMAESDVAAFRILIALGWEPIDRTTGDPLPIEPGRWIGSTNKDAKVETVEGVDLTQFINTIESFMYWVAMVTDTPVSRFVTTKQVASEGSQKEQGGPLITKVRNRCGEVGNGWEDALGIARRLENTFGRGGLDEEVELFTAWQPLEARDEKAELEQAQIRKNLGMPIRLVAKGLDLTQEEIQLWETEAETRRQTMQAQLGQGGQNEAAQEEGQEAA